MPRLLCLLDFGACAKCSMACDDGNGFHESLRKDEYVPDGPAEHPGPSDGLRREPGRASRGPRPPSPRHEALDSAPASAPLTEEPQLAPQLAPQAAKWEEPRFEGGWVDPGVPEGIEDLMDLKGFGWLKKKVAMAAIRAVTNRVTIWKEGPKLMFETVNMSTEVKGFVPDGSEFKDKFGMDQEDGTGRGFWEGDTLVMEVSLPEVDVRTTRRLVDENHLAESMTLTRKTDGKSASLSRVYDRA